MTLAEFAAAVKDDSLIQVSQGTTSLLAFFSKGYASIDATLQAAVVTEVAAAKTNTGIKYDVKLDSGNEG